MDSDDPINEFRKHDPTPQNQSAGRSAADAVIEEVGDFDRPKPKPSNGCPQCSSVEVRTTRPLGAAPRNLCRDCGHRWLGGPRSPAKLVLAKIGPTQTSVAGPYYRGSAVKSRVDKHSPKSRLKGKSLSALKGKK